MRILSNPWTGIPGYNCFGCCDTNPIGLKMKFTETEDCVKSEWIANPDFQGYHNVLHGGIQASLIDEIAGWTIFVKANTGGVTSRLEIKYKKPVVLDDKPVSLKCYLLEINKRIARLKVELFNSKGELCTEGEADYFVLSEEMAKLKFSFPGKEAFYK
ncbi:MAG: PaaI family thioesterase [Bacteroidales bacterium]|nr:PaaI family thioesterase [Bacteroidales bacterium]